MLPRTSLVVVGSSVRSSYDAKGATGGPRPQLILLGSRAGGKLTPDAASGLVVLDAAVTAAGGDLRVTDCFRSTAEQAAARNRYLNWVSAGRPRVGSTGFNAVTMKSAYVAVPGRSMHNAGRAIDIHVDALAFPGTPAREQLDKLWAIAIPLGWQPVISHPTEGASESWHFDFWGPFKKTNTRLGYEQAAIAAVLDIGDSAGYPNRTTERRLQAGLHRAGFDVGMIDGLPGPATKQGLARAGFLNSALIADPKILIAAVSYVDRLVDG